MEIHVKICLISISSRFQVFEYDLIIYSTLNFPVAKLEAHEVIDYVTNWVTYRIHKYQLIIFWCFFYAQI